MTPDALPRLSSLGLIQLTGPDARGFLQGQLSHDMQLLSPHQSLLASCNSAQGRVQAVVTVIERGDGILLLLPGALTANILARLRKYVLRAKVVLNDVTAQYGLFSADRDGLKHLDLAAPAAPGEHRELQHLSLVRWRDPVERYLVIAAAAAAPGSAADADWQLADIRAGLPQVFPETNESFVAQMLNLDVLDGISFNKGCYTGQEVIARTHYRGAVKRRMFRLQASCSPPAPGTRVLAHGNHAGDVVMSARAENGCEMLAVLSLAHVNEPLELAAPAGAGLRRLSLPYEIPTD